MIEEIPNARIEGPRIMIWCILIGMASGFIFLSCLLFVLKDVQTVIESPAGALLQMYFDATNSKAGSICLIVFSIVCMVFTACAIMTTSARMTYAFSRDRGLPFSHIWAKYNEGLEVPLNALLWTTGWVIIFGLILLGSSSAFNAITAASVVALGKFFIFSHPCSGSTNIQKVSLMQSLQLSTFSVAETYFPKTAPSSLAPLSDGFAVLSVLRGPS